MAVAARETGNKDRHVVAVIGDGAMSGGLAFEGLNNVSSTPNDMLIILNDNDMSIDRAVGGMEKYLPPARHQRDLQQDSLQGFAVAPLQGYSQ